MRSSIYIFILLLSFVLETSANTDKEVLEQTIKDIIQAYNSKNDTLLNQYINADNGLYFVLKSNSDTHWMNRRQICLKKECVNKLNLPNPYGQILLEQQLDTTSNIVYESSNLAKENIDNLIIVDEQELHILTNTIRKLKQQNTSYVNSKELRRIWKIESSSKRISVTGMRDPISGRNFEFYLSFLNNNWYLSIIVLTTKFT